MLLKAGNDQEFEKAPIGTHIARCYLIADLGTQEIQTRGGTKRLRKIRFVWELPTKLMEDGRPFSVGETYTASLYSQSTLRPILEAWRGAPFTPEEEENGFDPGYFLMRPCFLNVTHGKSEKTGKVYANVTTVMQLPDGIDAPPVVNPPVYFSLDSFSQQDFDLLPEWIQETIKKSPEYQALMSPDSLPKKEGVPGVDYPTTEEDFSDIPF